MCAPAQRLWRRLLGADPRRLICCSLTAVTVPTRAWRVACPMLAMLAAAATSRARCLPGPCARRARCLQARAGPGACVPWAGGTHQVVTCWRGQHACARARAGRVFPFWMPSLVRAQVAELLEEGRQGDSLQNRAMECLMSLTIKAGMQV